MGKTWEQAPTAFEAAQLTKPPALRGVSDFPLLTRQEMPEIGIHFVRATDKPIAGMGEEVVGWIAPAVCNAIFAATGKRVRSLPVKNHDLRWG